MPVTVTTQWHDIKEVHKDMYIIERTYKVEPDLKNSNKILETSIKHARPSIIYLQPVFLYCKNQE